VVTAGVLGVSGVFGIVLVAGVSGVVVATGSEEDGASGVPGSGVLGVVVMAGVESDASLVLCWVISQTPTRLPTARSGTPYFTMGEILPKSKFKPRLAGGDVDDSSRKSVSSKSLIAEPPRWVWLGQWVGVRTEHI
jgi:hypothetical protein